MALQRQIDPLAEGRYWLDVDPKNVASMQTFFKAFSGLGMHVETTERRSDGGSFFIFTWKPAFPGAVVTWDAKTYGYPTIAPADVKASSDTVQRPDLPQDAADKLADAVTSVSGNQMLAAGAVVALGLVALLALKFKR